VKRADWGRVKRGDRLIYADEYEGVFQAKVLEVDIRLYEPGEPSRYGYPYGKTEITGSVRIEIEKAGVKTELIENLANLIPYGPEKLRALQTLYETLAKYRAAVDASKEEFNAQVLAWKGL